MSDSGSKDKQKRQVWKKLKDEARWLLPGTGFKRWILLAILGSMMLGLGLAVLILGYYRSASNPSVVPILAFLSLRWLDRPIRFVLFGGIGLAMILVGIWGANHSLLKPSRNPDVR